MEFLEIYEEFPNALLHSLWLQEIGNFFELLNLSEYKIEI